MNVRTPLQVLRSLALSTVCTRAWLDRYTAGTLPGCQPLVVAQLDHLLTALVRLDRLAPDASTGLASPGAGEHMLAVIAEAVTVPDTLDDWPMRRVSAFPALSDLLDRLSANLAADTPVDGHTLHQLCGDLARAAVAARTDLA